MPEQPEPEDSDVTVPLQPAAEAEPEAWTPDAFQSLSPPDYAWDD